MTLGEYQEKQDWTERHCLHCVWFCMGCSAQLADIRKCKAEQEKRTGDECGKEN